MQNSESSTAVLCDCLCSFWDGMLGKFTWKEESYSSLYLSAWEGVLLVVSDKLWWFEGDLLEDIIDEWVHNVHRPLRDSSFWVNLLENSVDINWESFSSSLLLLFTSSLVASFLLCGLGSRCISSWSYSLLWSHFFVLFVY